MFNNDNDNVIGSLLGTLFFAGCIAAARYCGKKDAQTEFAQNAKDQEFERLKKENEELKRQVPQVLRDLPPTRF